MVGRMEREGRKVDEEVGIRSIVIVLDCHLRVVDPRKLRRYLPSLTSADIPTML
jgi:hypothetical protein